MDGPSAGNVEHIDQWLSEERPERSRPTAVDQRDDSRTQEEHPIPSSQSASWNWNDGWYYHSWNHRRPYWGSYYDYGTWGSQQQSGEDSAAASQQFRPPGADPAGSGGSGHGAETRQPEQPAGTQAEDPWLTNDPWRRGSQDWWQWDSSWNWGWSSGRDWSSSKWEWDRSQNFKPDYSDPPAWPGWTHRRYWVTAIRRWDRSTDIPMHKRAEKVLRVLGWEMQADFEHLTESTLVSDRYLQEILRIMDNKAGVRDDDEKRRLESTRRKDETLAQYSMRRQRDFSRIVDYGLNIPTEFQAMMMREGAGLNEQNHQNLSALLQGQEQDPDAMARALAKMDVRQDRLSGFADAEGAHHFFEEDDVPEGEEESPSEDDEEVILSEIDGLNLSEDQVAEVFAVLDGRRKRSWKENQLYKASARKDRGSFVKGERSSSSAPRGSHGGIPGTRPRRSNRREKMNKEQLKKVTKCRRCGVKGHWEEDCTQPGGQQGQRAKLQAFTYVSNNRGDSTTGFAFLSIGQLRSAASQVLDKSCEAPCTYLTLTSGEAILDIGATQDLIGQVALTALESVLRHVGLQVVEVDFNPTVPMGIGGMAEALKTILVPISPGGVPGVVEMTVLKNDIPPLLSVGLLDFLKAKIDLEKNTIHLKQIDVKLTMGRLTSGHRTIPLVQWNRASGTFPVPDEIQDKYGLGPSAFDLNHKTQSPLAYTKEPSRVSFSLAVHEDFVHVTGDSVRVSSQPNALVEPNHCNDSVVIGNVQGFREGEFQEDASNHESHARVSVGRSIHDDSNSSRVPKPMGSIGSRCPPKFESSTHSHGVSPQEDAAATMQRRGESDHVDSLDDSGVHDDGKSPVEILSTGHCRVSNQECGFGKEEVCGAAGGGQQLMPSSSCQDSEAGKSVCLLDGVWSLRKSTDLSNQESCGTTQEKVNSSSQGSPTDCAAVGSLVLSWAPQNVRGYSEAPDCDTRRSLMNSSRASSSNSAPMAQMQQFENFMQNLVQGLTQQQGQLGNNVAQVGMALQELAKGQNQMISLLQQTQVVHPEDATMSQGPMPVGTPTEHWELMEPPTPTEEEEENPNSLDAPGGRSG